MKSLTLSFLLAILHSPRLLNAEEECTRHLSLLQLQVFSKPVQESALEALKVVPLDGEVGAGSWQATDWLYTSDPGSCQQAKWDMTKHTSAVRVLLLLLFLVLIAFVVINGRADHDNEGAGSLDVERDNERQPQRRHDLDYARIICVACVVTEHSGGSHWTSHNTMFVLQWVLPYLYLTSAISWMMSTKGVWMYCLRLSVVLVVGVLANWVADAHNGRDWQGDFGNTVFQMFYVVMLIAMSMLTAPLRQALCHQKNNYPKAGPAVGWRLWAALFSYGIITLVGFAGLFAERQIEKLTAVDAHQHLWSSNIEPLINAAPLAFIQVGGVLFLSHLACLFRANDILPWLLILHIYIPRIFIPWTQVGFVHNLELFVFGMVADSWLIRGRRTIATLLQNYWPIIIFLMMLATMPDMYGRCDLLPPAACLERLRFYGVELALCLFLSSRALKVGDPWNATGWLNYWALSAYCFHVAWARIFPIPYGAVLTYSSSILFYAAWRSGNHKQGAPSHLHRDSESIGTKEGPDEGGG